MLDILILQTMTSNSGVPLIIYTKFVAFPLSVSIGITYVKTFRGPTHGLMSRP